MGILEDLWVDETPCFRVGTWDSDTGVWARFNPTLGGQGGHDRYSNDKRFSKDSCSEWQVY